MKRTSYKNYYSDIYIDRKVANILNLNLRSLHTESEIFAH